MGTSCSFPGVKWPEQEAYRLHPSSAEVKNIHLVPRLRMSGAVSLLVPTPSWCAQGRHVYFINL